MKILTNLDLTNNQLLNAVLQNLTTHPTGKPIGFVYYNTADNVAYVNTSTGWQPLTDTIQSVNPSAPISANIENNTLNISIQAASSTQNGYMSSSDKDKLDKATSANTPNTLVMRDEFGDVSFGNITATVVDGTTFTGTAIKAKQFDTQRTLTLTGKVSGSLTAYFSSSDDLTINTTVNLSADDIPTLTSAKISDFNNAVRANRLDQMAAPTSPVNMNNQRLTNLATPVSSTDAATKEYVDATRMGLDFKESVKVAISTNIDTADKIEETEYAHGTEFDGVAIYPGDRVLLIGQTDPTENGIYKAVDTSHDDVYCMKFYRAPDADSDEEVTPGMFVFVEQGTHADSGWVLATDGPIDLGNTALQFVQFSGAGQITAGNGLSKNGNELYVNTYSGSNANRGRTAIVDDAVAVVLGTGANEAAAGNHTHYLFELEDTAWLNNTSFGYGELIYFDGLYWNAAAPDTVLPGAVSTVLTSNLTEDRVVVSNSSGKLEASEITSTELFYLYGVTSNIQTQLNARTRKYATNIGDGTNTSFNISHNLGTNQVVVSIYDKSTGEMVYTDVSRVDANTISVSFASAPATNAYEVVIVG